LALEITEQNLMQDPEDADRCLRELKLLGLRLLIDDFGTGYSSLSYLSSFPIDALKVDRSFVKGLPDDAGKEALTTAIIAMARSLEMGVIAEGVETEDQLALLRSLGCDLVQGFLLARPLPPADFARFLTERESAEPRLAVG
jgi:EAL domain-containing protein (putative c-di-GMP-specific phosphodiesterase class I)